MKSLETLKVRVESIKVAKDKASYFVYRYLCVKKNMYNDERVIHTSTLDDRHLIDGVLFLDDNYFFSTKYPSPGTNPVIEFKLPFPFFQYPEKFFTYSMVSIDDSNASVNRVVTW